MMEFKSKYTLQSKPKSHNQHRNQSGFCRNLFSIFNCDKTFERKFLIMPNRTIKPLMLFTVLQFLLSFAHGQGPGVNFNVKEEQPIDTYIGVIPVRDGLKYRLSSHRDVFNLDETTGEIRTAIVIDRESLESDSFNLYANTFPSVTDIIQVNINVLDINDNDPTFENPRINVAYSENAKERTQIILDTATDQDVGINDVTTKYKIISGNEENKFRLFLAQETSKPLLYLENTVKLDREEKQFYTLNISAQDDNEETPRFGYLQVDITITDVNDNVPNFDHSEYSISVNETIPISTSIIQVTATDRDLDQNAEITYEIISEQNKFWIDPKSGEVRTLQELDCKEEMCLETVITVQAKDNGQIPLVGRAYITVTLIDENNHDPVIQFSESEGRIDEGAELGKLVVRIVLVDLDVGENANVSLSILKGNERGHFRLKQLGPKLSTIEVASTLDREKINKYNLTILARDNGVPPRSSMQHFVIFVNDINDHEPVFLQSSYRAELSELVPKGSFVVGVRAMDNDTGDNAVITYSIISGNELGWFQINSETGLITTKLELDKERKFLFLLTVQALDGGATAYSSTVNVTVTIWDENDEEPKFGQPIYTVVIIENEAPGPLSIFATAIDQDQGKNGTVTYMLHPSVDMFYPGIFQVHSNTGRISTLTEINREVYPSFDILLLAKDQGQPALTSSAEIFITVQDVNDNVPIFYPVKYYTNVLENQPSSQTVVQVFATDIDSGQNGKVFYSIQNGANSNFQIDPNNGIISTTRSLSKNTHTLIITAVDGSGRTANNIATIEVIVISQQDTLPQFSKQGGYSFSVVENDNEGVFVGQVFANNANGEQSLSYTIVSGDVENDFVINGNNGNINTNRSLNRERIATYNLKIIAYSSNSFASTDVAIIILDINDNSPVFYLPSTTIYIEENLPVGTGIFVANANDPDYGENATLTYSFQPGALDNFVIDSATGLISISAPLEDITQRQIDVTVKAQDSGSTSLSSNINVKLIITDVNDHTPEFNRTVYDLVCVESLPVNTRFFHLNTIDLDQGQNGKVTYEIVGGNDAGKFGVFPDGVLYIAKQLDREMKDLYVLVVKVKDFGQLSRYSFINVTIHILDANDNDPSFMNDTFRYSLFENSAIGVSIGRIYAKDEDLGKNRDLFFYIDADYQGFQLNSQTGVLTTTRSFDREALVNERGTSDVTLSVIVEDNGVPLRSSKTTVIITILDLNDMIPEFNKKMYEVSINEITDVGSDIITVTASDNDIGQNANVKYSILKGNENNIFKIIEDTGNIVLNKVLNRETEDLYHLNVMATDMGYPALNTTAMVRIKIQDYNDNPPVFNDGTRVFNLSELTPIRYYISTFRATDFDLGNNALITYDITGGNIGMAFNIESRTGKLTLATPLDFDMEMITYYLNITAIDNGLPRLKSTITVEIHVFDENDHAPSFTTESINKEIEENIDIGLSVLQVLAEDMDSGINGEITYSLVNQIPQLGSFSIDPITGWITTASNIDRELTNEYALVVRATDNASPVSKRLHSDKEVNIIVNDKNDNPPVFVSQKAASVLLTATVNTIITRIKAIDIDFGINAEVEYTILGTNRTTDSNYFSIESSTGNLYLRKTLSQSVLSYDLTVKAQDKGQTAKSTYHNMKIIPRLNNENGPTFLTSTYEATINENSPPDKSIITVSARYQGGTTTLIKYYITKVTAGENMDVQRFFDIKNPEIGTVTTTQELDREVGYGQYNVEITAMDTLANEPKTRSVNVQVTILDQNDSPPVFTTSVKEVSVSEDTDLGQTSIAIVTATDPDEGGELLYSIVDGSDGKFTIDPSSGDIYVQSALDRETKSVYTVTVGASDGVQESHATLIITVTDVNDEKPLFLEPAYYFDILESTDTAVSVGEVTAIDQDEGINAQVTYQIQSTWGRSKFSLDRNTGIFTLIGNLDYEEYHQYVLTVRAQDSGLNSKFSTVTVYMNIIDENDNSPLFDPSSYSIEVMENATLDTSVMQVTATDIDAGDNSRIEYYVIGGDIMGVFDLNPDTGILTMAGMLDRETEASYNLVVEAMDQTPQPGTKLSSTALISVTVADVNDNAPEFEMPATIVVKENSIVGSAIYTITASDLDQNNNGVLEFFLLTSADNLFTIGQNDGILKLNGPLDREFTKQYVINIRASDKGQPPLFTDFLLTIIVGDNNDHNPVFSPKTYEKNLDEDKPVGTSLFTLVATDGDIGINADIRYIVTSGDETQSFYVDSHTGAFSINYPLDYESKQSYHIEVMAYDLGKPERYDLATVSITINDVNDCKPSFLNVPYIAYIQENIVETPVYVTQVEATDCDSEYRGLVSYSINEGGADRFVVDSSSGIISATQQLDRETVDSYELIVKAVDSGSPRQSSFIVVTVHVADDNDHTPTFEHAQYRGVVMENVEAPVYVAQVTAVDLDSGNNGLVSYSLVSDGSGQFAVNTDTGEITTTSSLDRELTSSYTLIVMATDNALLQRSSTVEVLVKVEDDNDNRPYFQKTTYDVKIRDPTSSGTFIVGVTAVDRDSGINSQIEYSLTNSADSAYVSIHLQTGIITANNLLSSSSHGTFEFSVTATDKGGQTASNTVLVQVQFLPSSTSQFPTFSGANVNLRPLETDTAITQVTATSSRPGASLTYHIAGGNTANTFLINQQSGLITLQRPLDYEDTNFYNLWIEARDDASVTVTLSSYLGLNIAVMDMNDSPPVFDKLYYNVSVAENEQPPVTVMAVTASDEDSGENGRVSYQLIETGSSHFAIDSIGNIRTTTRLDREAIDHYMIVVIATDNGVPKNTATATVDIKVADRNDVEPTFTRHFNSLIPENAPLGTSVLKITTTDGDIGENAVSTYQFVQPTDMFAINRTTGWVTLTGNLDRETKATQYLLKVTASDGAHNKQTSITIDVLDINDNPPVFNKSKYVFHVADGHSAGSSIGVIGAVDADGRGSNSDVWYRMKYPQSMFFIDSKTGNLTPRMTINYIPTPNEESGENTYILYVLAFDRGDPMMSNEVKVTVRVLPTNAHVPQFDASSYFLYVAVNSPQMPVGQVSASDGDFGESANLTYTKTAGNGTLYFDVEAKTGVLHIINSLENQINRWLVIIVKAEDSGAPPKSVEVTVIFNIIEMNMHDPVFDNVMFSANAPENSNVGSNVIEVSASDSDQGLNGQVVYYITGGNEEGRFSIDENDRYIKVNKPLDYETTKIYKLTVTAKDKGPIPREANHIFTIFVTDINDYPPVFEQNSYNAFVDENLPAGSTVYIANAVDLDSQNQVEYFITGNQQAVLNFEVSQTIGLITTKSMLDYEIVTDYTIIVKAINPGTSPELSGSTSINVHVVGVNEYKPVFGQEVYNFDVQESASPLTSVGTVKATDQDNGIDGIVHYYLVGDSNLQGFIVDTYTGAIILSSNIDREATSEIVLSIMARNSGPISEDMMDWCEVRIRVGDANDPPRFTELLYEAKIPENSQVSTSVIQVTANDNDLNNANSQFIYTILDGNVGDAFAIGIDSGIITVNAELDKETLPVYTLIAAATDAGSPPKTGSTTVKITLEDINDNGPYFIPTIPIGNVTENVPIGNEVAINLVDVTFDRDIDINSNQIYRYTILNHLDKFRVGETTGLVQAKVELDREEKAEYVLQLRVIDAGSPTMTSTLTLNINVKDQNDNPSRPRPMTVEVHTYLAQIASGPIASVHPLDQDEIGNYMCQLGSSAQFTIPSGCDLHPNTNINQADTYTLDITGSDGDHSEVSYKAIVNFKDFTKKMVDNSIVLRLENKKASSFLNQSYNVFVSALDQVISGQGKIELYSMKESGSDLDLFIAPKQENGKMLSRNALIQIIQSNLASIESQTSVAVKNVHYNPCANSPCQNGGECSINMDLGNVFRSSETDGFVFTSTSVEQNIMCTCTSEYKGHFCEELINKCQQNPCKNQGTCSTNTDGGYNCECISTWEGSTCEKDIDECKAANPCLNGGTCVNSQGSYRCDCPSSYTGKDCYLPVRSCSLRPCKNNAICNDINSDFECQCTYGYRGQTCEIGGIGFNTMSFMQYTQSLDSEVNIINIEFATVKTNAMLLLYSSASTYEFLAVEVVQGKVRLSYALGNTPINGYSRLAQDLVQVTSPVIVSDGKWYSIVASRNNKVGSVKVSLCEEGKTFCSVCQNDDSSCHATATGGINQALDTSDSTLNLGGVENFGMLSNIPVNSHDFVGCMRSVEVDGLDLFKITPKYSNGTTDTCPRTSAEGECPAVKLAKICEDGECIDEWNRYSCQCLAEKTGVTCSKDKTSVSLGTNANIQYHIKSSYKGDVQLSSRAKRKRRAASHAYSFSLRFRTYEKSGLILYAAMDGYGQNLTVYLVNGKLSCQTLVTDTDVSDGEWYNVTLIHSGTDLTMSINSGGSVSVGGNVISLGLWDKFSLGNAHHPDRTAFNGCVDKFLVNGESLPFRGYSDKYEISASDGVTATCTGYLILAGKDGPPSQIVIIVICTLFAVILIGVLFAFVIIIYRRKMKEKKQPPPYRNGSATFSKTNGTITSNSKKNNDSGRSHPDSGIAEDENNFISEHIQNELNGGGFDEREIRGSLQTNKPDVVDAIDTDRNIDESDDGFDNTGYSDGPPEHYDFDNASSIAPSDLLDFTNHYKRYRLGQVPSHNKYKQGGHKHVHHRHTPSPSNMLAARQSPASVSVQMGRQSPADMLGGRITPQPKSQLTVENVNQLNRQTPVNQLSRASPAPNIPVGRDRMGPTSMRSTPLSGISAMFPSNISNSTSYSESTPNGHVRNSRPNSKLKQPINQVGMRNTPTKGLTIEEVHRLNARHTPPTTLDAISSSSEEDIKNNINQTDFTHSDLLEPNNSMLPPESSSEEETNDSFTCSEFEDDHKIRNDRHPRGGNNNFSRLPRVNENDDTDTTLSRAGVGGRHIDTDSNRESHSTFFTASEEDFPRKIAKTKLPNGALSVDYMLNWGNNYEKLMGVFQDIAQLSQPEVSPVKSSPNSQPNSRPNSRTSLHNDLSRPYLPPKPSRVTSPGMRATGQALPKHMVRSPLPQSPLITKPPLTGGGGTGSLIPNGHIKQSSIASIASSHDRQSSVSSVHSSRSGRPTSSNLSHHPFQQQQTPLVNHSRSSSTLSNNNNHMLLLHPHHSPSSSTLSANMSYMPPTHSRSSSKSSLSSRPSSQHNSMYNPLNPQPPPPPPAMAQALQFAENNVNIASSPVQQPPAREEYV